MQQRWRHFWLGVAGTVVGSVLATGVLSLLGRFVGWWPTIWAGFKSPAPVPIAVLVFLTISTLYAWGRIVADARMRLKTSNPGSDAPAGHFPPLSDGEQKVLKVFASVDGKVLLVDHLVRHTDGVKLMAENAVDELIARGFLEVAGVPTWGPDGVWYGLTVTGRKYLIDNGYVGVSSGT